MSDDFAMRQQRTARAAHDAGLAGLLLTPGPHEPPYMVEGDIHLLQPGMCFSIEPGIYLPGRFRVRIEDIVTVIQDGGRRLNRTPHEMAIVE